MPNLSERLKRGGLSFDNHVAALPVCGPSRSSLLYGRYPHNTGYFDNCDAVSMANFRSKQNDTIGRWLAKSGYHTAFLGKYVNCLEYDVPSGWSHWGGFRSSGNTYNSYNATMYTVDFDQANTDMPPASVSWESMVGIHQADFLGGKVINQARVAIGKGLPFFVHVTPVLPHWTRCYGPFASIDDYAFDDPSREMAAKWPISPCATPRHQKQFAGMTNPHIPSWNKQESGVVPEEMQRWPLLDAMHAHHQDIGWRNRSVRSCRHCPGQLWFRVTHSGSCRPTGGSC